ncbi:MAG: aldo/keto reductase [Anaerolineales bacterium]
MAITTLTGQVEKYADGHSEELIGEAVRGSGKKREELFITSKVTPSHLKYDDVLKACEGSLRRLNMDYIDLYLIHWPGTGTKYEETFRALNKLVRDGRVKHLGVSNFDLKLLKRSQELSETPISSRTKSRSAFQIVRMRTTACLTIASKTILFSQPIPPLTRAICVE